MTRIQTPGNGTKESSYKENLAGVTMEDGGRKELEALWTRVCDRLRKEIGDKAFKTWFGEVELGELKAGKLRLYAPTRFVRDWVGRHYGDRVLAYWQSVAPDVKSVEVNLVPPPAPRRPNDIIAMPPVPSPQNYQPPMPRMGPSIGRGTDEAFSGPEARYTFANFVVGKPNEFAYAAARNIAEQDRPLPERNPLYIFGGVGLGKTHLMHAIWHTIRERDPKTRVLYLTAESFVNRFIQALRTKNTNQFKELFRNVDVLMVDDVQFICGKEASQDEFFFTFNSLVEQNKQIVLSSEKPPSELQDIEERMRSRLGSGLVADDPSRRASAHAPGGDVLRAGDLPRRAFRGQFGLRVQPRRAGHADPRRDDPRPRLERHRHGVRVWAGDAAPRPWSRPAPRGGPGPGGPGPWRRGAASLQSASTQASPPKAPPPGTVAKKATP